ncbi:Ectopic P granules protein 5 [Irineochytrium annulatum]|nr:Ectopic P granules protein 5 [Irineochytrium annulatum]
MVDDLDTASAVTAEYIKLVQKFFKHSSYIKGICAYAWSLYARFQRFKPPAYFLPVLHQNLQELNWEAFEIDEEVVAQIDEWAATRDTNDSLLTIDVHRFLCHVLSSGNWSMREFTPTLSTFESGSSLMRSLTILFTLITNVDTIFPELDSRRTFFTQISTRVGNWCDWRIFPPASYANVIAVLPAKWTSNAETLFAEDAQLSFHYCLNLLKLLIGFESINHAGEIESNKNILTKMTFSKLEFFFDYILDLISTQMTKVPSVSNMSVTEIAAPNSTAGDSRPNKATPLAFSAKTFSPDRIGSHLVELFGFVDAILPTTSEKGHFLYQIIHRVFTILNASSKSTKEYGRLWEGVNLAVRATHDPIVWLSLACQTIASAEYMALIAEICIERHRELMRSTRGFDPDDLEGWKAPVASLAVPELEAETFIRHCLSHALLLTLHVHALQKLEEVSDNPDLRVMIGEQLGIWIAGVKMETVEEGKEGKMVLLLLKFGELLEVELADLVLPEHHSRLRGQLPAVAEALLKWGQDRANQGLWATLGFGPKSRLSSEFRLFARAVGAFVVMRLIGPTSAAGSTTAAIGKREEEQKAKLVESVASTLQNRDFETSWHRVEALVSFLKDEEEKRLVALREFVIIAGWFSEYC